MNEELKKEHEALTKRYNQKFREWSDQQTTIKAFHAISKKYWGLGVNCDVSSLDRRIQKLIDNQFDFIPVEKALPKQDYEVKGEECVVVIVKCIEIGEPRIKCAVYTSGKFYCLEHWGSRNFTLDDVQSWSYLPK